MLPTDLKRQLSEVLKVSTIIAIQHDERGIVVKSSSQAGHETPWMAYSYPFVGNTAIFCYPKIGMGGLIVSESGENEVNRFLPIYDVVNLFNGLSETDFKIFLHNGDFIHHAGNDLNTTITGTISANATSAIINVTDATVNAEILTANVTTATVNASHQCEITAPMIQLNGNVQIAGSLSQIAGSDGSKGTAKFTAPVEFQEKATFKDEVTAEAEVTVKGKAISSHTHDYEDGGGTTGEMQ